MLRNIIFDWQFKRFVKNTMPSLSAEELEDTNALVQRLSNNINNARNIITTSASITLALLIAASAGALHYATHDLKGSPSSQHVSHDVGVPSSSQQPSDSHGIDSIMESPYSEKVTWADLWDDGTLSVSVYFEDPEEEKSFREYQQTLVGPPVAYKVLNSRQEFETALAEDDFVVFFGHANLGRGMNFSRGQGYDLLRMGKDEILIKWEDIIAGDKVIEDRGENVLIKAGSSGLDGLVINADVVIYSGCRTNIYYSDVFKGRFPDVEFVGTNFVPIYSQLAPLLVSLEFTLASEHGISTFLSVINKLNAPGRAESIDIEINDYGNVQDSYPEALFSN